MNVAIKSNHIKGKAAADLSGKMAQLGVGEALTLPSPMPGISNDRVTAVLTECKKGTTLRYAFDLFWQDTYIGEAIALETPKGITLEGV